MDRTKNNLYVVKRSATSANFQLNKPYLKNKNKMVICSNPG